MPWLRVDPLCAAQLWFGGQAGAVCGRWHRQAVGQWGGTAWVVPLVHAVGRWRLAAAADGVVGRQDRRHGWLGSCVDAARLRHAAAAERGDPAAVTARAGG